MIFWGLRFSIPGFLGVGKFGKYFFAWVDLKGMSQPCSSANEVPPNFLRLGNTAWDFSGVKFWSRDFLRFC